MRKGERERHTVQAVVFELEQEEGGGSEIEFGEGEVADLGIGDLVLAFRWGLVFVRGMRR